LDEQQGSGLKLRDRFGHDPITGHDRCVAEAIWWRNFATEAEALAAIRLGAR